ncbi:MAG: ATP-binding protein [Spirochaetes bacterium]|nr:ATP-binding protein [Spirochaetota bacterium]
MPAEIKKTVISYDEMKKQMDNELSAFISSGNETEYIEMPKYFFEKGICRISFNIPGFNEVSVFNILQIMKNHIENIRIHTMDPGYYAFQALNSNLFKTEDILDNIKIEIFGITANHKVEISKKANFTQEEVNLAIEIFRYFHNKEDIDAVSELKKLGASVYIENNSLSWNYIAGYEDVKRKIRESVILPLQNPDVYDSIAKLTRQKFESNRPKAILFEGSPGVGKTTIARIIAGEVKIPLVYLPIESIMSKWYGQSAKNLSEIFDYCEELGSCILFLDEIDSLAGSRDQNMFEATRRILSVLLRRLDGIESVTNTITIGATNRKNDLDTALISRFDQTIFFPLPNQNERSAIFSNYARHLSQSDLDAIGLLSDGLSGRNIKDICEYSERRWARKIIIKKEEVSVPPADYYKYSVNLWLGKNNIES